MNSHRFVFYTSYVVIRIHMQTYIYRNKNDKEVPMLNYLWAFMIISGILFSIITGNISSVTDAAINSSKEAIALCITMLGIMSFWTGLMEIAAKAGMIESASKRMYPLIHFLFPRIPKNHPACKHITTNFIANILGLGWAATPAGLKAMEALRQLEEERQALKTCRSVKNLSIASDEMCTFLILNISSLQLIPINVIAYRSQYGSASPAAIVGAGIIATLISTLAGIVFCKLANC